MSYTHLQNFNTESKNRGFSTYLRSTSEQANKQAEQSLTLLDFTRPIIQENFDGRVEWKDYLAPIYDQGDCAGCYAFATVSALADKYALMTLLQIKPVFNPMETLICMFGYKEGDTFESHQKLKADIDLYREYERTHLSTACTGNTIYNVGRSLYRRGAVEDSCVPMNTIITSLKDKGHLPVCSILEGPDTNLCADNTVAKREFPVDSIYTLSIKNEDELIDRLKLEVMKLGPLVVAFNVFPDFLDNYDGKTIYIPKDGQKSLGGHAVKLVGWGIENDIPYWICANSWGVNWGENGYFKIIQGNKSLELEKNHMGLIPYLPNVSSSTFFSKSNPVFDEDDVKTREYNNVNTENFYPQVLIPKIKSGLLKGNLNSLISAKELPEFWDYWAYIVNKTDFLSGEGVLTSISRKYHVSFTTTGRGGYYISDKDVIIEIGQLHKRIGYLVIIVAILVIILIFILYRNRR